MTGGNLYVGGKEAETVLNGSVSMIAEYGKESTATIDGDKITINATITPDKFQNGSDRNQSLAIYDQDTDLTIGNDGTRSTVINGNLEFSGNKAVMYGNEITINGSFFREGDKVMQVKTTTTWAGRAAWSMVWACSMATLAIFPPPTSTMRN